MADVVDPLGGSYYVEDLTRRLEEGAWEYIRRIDEMGGAVTALEQGFQMGEIHQAAYQHQMDVEAGRRTIVGVNKYRTEDPPDGSSLKVDEEAAHRQTARLERVRRERDGADCVGGPGSIGGSGPLRRQHGSGYPGVRGELLHTGGDMRRFPWGLRRAAGDGRAVGCARRGCRW